MKSPHPGKKKPTTGGAKCDRLLHLLILMQGGPPRSADALAEALGVSRRSLFRYLQTFEQCSIPYFHDEAARGYRIREDFFLRPPALTIDEARALAHACFHNGTEYSAALSSAWSKIAAVLPRHVASALALKDGDIIVSLPGREKTKVRKPDRA